MNEQPTSEAITSIFNVLQRTTLIQRAVIVLSILWIVIGGGLWALHAVQDYPECASRFGFNPDAPQLANICIDRSLDERHAAYRRQVTLNAALVIVPPIGFWIFYFAGLWIMAGRPPTMNA